MVTVLFAGLIYFRVVQNSEAQELRPAVLVSKNEGVFRTENVYLGFMGCSENRSGDLSETVIKQNSKINEINNKLEQFQDLITNIYNLTGNKFLTKNLSKSANISWGNSYQELLNEISNLKDEIGNLQVQLSKMQDELNICRFNKTGIFSHNLEFHCKSS